MPVPEASVNEDDGTTRRKHQIGAAGQIFAVKAEAEAMRMQAASYQELRLGVFGTDASHVQTPLLRCKHISHEGLHSWAASATTFLSAVAMSVTLMPGCRVTAPKRKSRRYSGWNKRPGIGILR